MVGSEKQIKWATEIRVNVIKTCQEVIDEFIPKAATNEIIRKSINYLQAHINLLNAENVHAGDIIDLYKDIRFSGDYRKDFMCIRSVLRITVPETLGQHILLMR